MSLTSGRADAGGRRRARRASAVPGLQRPGRRLARASSSPAAEAECGAGGVALVAVGGYGRAELSLQSDIDVVLLHTGRSDIGALADRVWYPIWDEGVKLGHAVRTPKEALTLAADDLDTATSFLQVRHVAGDEDLTDDLARRVARAVAEAGQAVARGAVAAGARSATRPRARWRSSSSPTSRRAAAASATCTPSAGPRRPGASSGRATTPPSRRPTARSSRPRVELHRRTGRPGDRLLLEEQDARGRSRSASRRPTRSCTRSRRPPARSPGAATTPGSGSTRRCAGPRAGGPGATGRSGPASCCATARCTSPPTPTRPPTRASCCAAAAAAAAGDTRIHRGSLDRLAAVGRRRCRSRGPTTCGGRWSTCSSPGTAPSPWSRRSTRWACGCTCSPSGRRCAASRSATPTTASPSTGT